MTNKPLIVLGVVIALAMAGGQANAQGTCPGSTTVGTVEAAGFSCTSGGLTFSSFLFNRDVPAGTAVDFAGTSVTFGTHTTAEGTSTDMTGSPIFDYTVTAGSNENLDDASLAIHGFLSTASGSHGASNSRVAVVTMLGGTSLGSLTAFSTPTDETGHSTDSGTFSPVSSINVMNAGTITLNHNLSPDRDTRLSQVINDFSVSPVVTPPTPTPEPMSLSLFGLGLAGLALVRRRRS